MGRSVREVPAGVAHEVPAGLVPGFGFRTMSDLAETYENVENAVLYVREAHPGAQIPAHRDFDEKRACAKRLATEDKEARLVLVDDVKGTAHQAFGGMPNSVFIVNRNGCVLYKSDWNNPSATKAALEALLDDHPVRAKSYFRPALPTVVFRTLKRAGKGSGPDFFRSLPSLIWNNLVKRNIRLLFGRPETAARDTTC